MQASQLSRGNGGTVLTHARHRPLRAKIRWPVRPFQQHTNTGSRKRASQIRAQVRLVAEAPVTLCEHSATFIWETPQFTARPSRCVCCQFHVTSNTHIGG